MGLFDQLIGGAVGQMLGGGKSQGGMLDMVMKLVQNYPGGIQGLVNQFTQAGFGQQAQSWVGTGQNMPIAPADLMKVFGARPAAELWAAGESRRDADRGRAGSGVARDHQSTHAQGAGYARQRIRGLAWRAARPAIGSRRSRIEESAPQCIATAATSASAEGPYRPLRTARQRGRPIRRVLDAGEWSCRYRSRRRPFR